MKKELMRTENGAGASLWDPFSEMRDLRNSITSLFDDALLGRGTRFTLSPESRTWAPAVDVQETADAYIFTAEAPGLGKDSIKVGVEDGVLTISGERKAEQEQKGKHWLRRELSYGSFQRSFALPSGVKADEIRAACKNGVLTVTVPKSEEARPRSVDVKVE